MNSEEKAEKTIELQNMKDYFERQILIWKSILIKTDWCVTKCSERGVHLAELYPDEAEIRAKAREQINYFENQLNMLKEC